MPTKFWFRPAALAGAVLATTVACSRPADTQSTEPADDVSVVAAASHTSYTGQCPPPVDRAPSFQAIITVAGGPTTVAYQWSTNGSSSNAAPHVLDFPGGGRQHAVISFTETSYIADYSLTGSVSVQVLSPRQVSTDPISFTTSCHTGRPHRYDPDNAQPTTNITPKPTPPLDARHGGS
jgi:hypothetical protein